MADPHLLFSTRLLLKDSFAPTLLTTSITRLGHFCLSFSRSNTDFIRTCAATHPLQTVRMCVEIREVKLARNDTLAFRC